MTKEKKLYLILTILMISIKLVQTQCCVTFQNSTCIQCPDGMHLYRNNCIYNVPNCKSYLDGFQCNQCNQGFTLDNSSFCQKIVEQPSIEQPIAQTTNIKSQNNSKLGRHFTDHSLSLPLIYKLNDRPVQGALVADQYLRAQYPQIKNANLTQALNRVYENQPSNSSDVYVVLVYQGKNNDLYKGLMMTNIQSFIFQQISFQKMENKSTITPIDNITISTANKNLQNNNSITNNTTNNTSNNIKIIQNGTIDSGFLLRNSSQSSTNIPITNNNNNNNIKNNTNNTQKNTSSSSVQNQPQSSNNTNTLSTNQSKSNNSTTQIKLNNISFLQQTDLQSLNDLYFVVLKNQINQQLTGYSSLVPLKVLVSDNHPDFASKLNGAKSNTQDQNYIYYQVFFNKTNSIYLIKCHIGILTYMPVIDQYSIATQAQLAKLSISNQTVNNNSQTTTSSNSNFQLNYTQTTVDSAGLYYIIFRNLISSKNSLLVNGVQKYVGTVNINSDIIGYKVILNININESLKIESFQIKGNVNKKTYQSSIDSITNITSKLNQQQNLTNKNQTINTNGSGGAIVIKQPATFQNITKNVNESTLSSNESSLTKPSVNLQDIVFGKNNNSGSPTNALQINPDLIMPRPSYRDQDTLSLSNPVDTLSNEQNFNGQNLTKTETPQQKISSAISADSKGYSYLSNLTYTTDPNIKYIDILLKQMNSSISGLQLYQVYIQNVGIQLKYKVYYLIGSNNYTSLYMGYVVYDYLTRRAFVLRFAQLV